jgi:RimJ/RimL family protein N-acetyltransferase
MSTPVSIRLRKASQVVGNTLTFRNATVEDAAFILSLRTDAVKSRYLSVVRSELREQQAWLQRYAHSDDQAYFIIEYQGRSIGTVRLYDPQGASFCWGSWVLHSDCPSHAGIESALMVYAYAVDQLGFSSAHFDVRKDNEHVWKFHERFGAARIAETALNYLYQIELPAITRSRGRYRRYLVGGVSLVASA